MAIYIKTDLPQSLVMSIREMIDKEQIRTWKYDNEGDFTHSNYQWENHAWFTPIFDNDMLIFGIIGRKDMNLSAVDYAIYHGRFVEMLLTHFDPMCQSIEITPLATKYDSIYYDRITI